MVGTRSLSSGARSRDPVASPIFRAARHVELRVCEIGRIYHFVAMHEGLFPKDIGKQR